MRLRLTPKLSRCSLSPRRPHLDGRSNQTKSTAKGFFQVSQLVLEHPCLPGLIQAFVKAQCTTARLFAGEVLLDLERAIRRASWNGHNPLFSMRAYYGAKTERQSHSEIVRN
jgi:hypothetical protein